MPTFVGIILIFMKRVNFIFLPCMKKFYNLRAWVNIVDLAQAAYSELMEESCENFRLCHL